MPGCGFVLPQTFLFKAERQAAAGVRCTRYSSVTTSALLDRFKARIAEETLFLEDWIGH